MAIGKLTQQTPRRHGNTRHGQASFGKRTKEYKSWQELIQRCVNPLAKGYERYGGRGIRVCSRWTSSFENFFADMGVRPSPRHSLDRIDNDGDYSPENCRWATAREQGNNRRTNIRLTHDGRTQTATEWAREMGLSPQTIWDRLRRGWTVERAVTTPTRPYPVRSRRV